MLESSSTAVCSPTKDTALASEQQPQTKQKPTKNKRTNRPLRNDPEGDDLCPLCKPPPKTHSQLVDTWIQCDVPLCATWYHAACLNISPEECRRFQKFHCPNCLPAKGPSTYKRKSVKDINYADVAAGVQWDRHIYTKMLQAREFSENNFPRIEGKELTMEWIRKTGLRTPVLVESPEGLDMTMPHSNLTANEVAELVGPDTSVDVMDVATQSELPNWTVREWATYFHSPDRDRILNVISLEIGETELGRKIVRPKVVRELDWVDICWPPNLKVKDYPKVQLYCLMGVKDSYTDFHIDFGGSSVFYHILRGEKIFYFIPPTPRNLKKYEKWSTSLDQGTVFLGDLVGKECYKVRLVAGNTMIIPTGWIHAVFTPEDTVVIGGNFLQPMNVGLQLDIYAMEKRTKVPPKFRFPFFERVCWYAARTYGEKLKDTPHEFSTYELDSFARLADFLSEQAAKAGPHPPASPGTPISKAVAEDRKFAKQSLPPREKDPVGLAARLKKRVRRIRANLDGSTESEGSSEEREEESTVSSTVKPVAKVQTKRASEGPPGSESIKKRRRKPSITSSTCKKTKDPTETPETACVKIAPREVSHPPPKATPTPTPTPSSRNLSALAEAASMALSRPHTQAYPLIPILPASYLFPASGKIILPPPTTTMYQHYHFLPLPPPPPPFQPPPLHTYTPEYFTPFAPPPPLAPLHSFAYSHHPPVHAPPIYTYPHANTNHNHHFLRDVNLDANSGEGETTDEEEIHCGKTKSPIKRPLAPPPLPHIVATPPEPEPQVLNAPPSHFPTPPVREAEEMEMNNGIGIDTRRIKATQETTTEPDASRVIKTEIHSSVLEVSESSNEARTESETLTSRTEYTSTSIREDMKSLGESKTN